MLYESKVSINPPELKSESSEQLYKNDMDLKNSVSKVVGYRGFFCIQVSQYLLEFYYSDRCDNETTQVHQVCVS